MRNGSIVALLLFILMLGRFGAFAQEPIPATKDYVAWAQEFLRTMYPDLNGKRYFLSLEAAGRYDIPGTSLQPYFLSIGEGPKYEVLGISGGCLSPAPPPPGAHIARPPLPREDCEAGPRHYNQVLEASFAFDNHDRLQSFGAHGTGIGNHKAGRAVAEQVWDRPEMTDAEITAALKRAGEKYGPDDKELLIRDFPYARLERFLGKLKIVHVTCRFTNRDIGNDNPLWEVTAEATQLDGTVITYVLRFERFKGELLNIWTATDR